MAYLRLFDPVNQFALKNGMINVSGRLFVYYEATDDLADIYDENGTQLQQPAILDNNGRARGLFVDAAKTYWMDVQDRYGESLFTIRKMTPCGGGGGSSLSDFGGIVSADGSIAVNSYYEAGKLVYDLSVADDTTDMLEWLHAEGYTNDNGRMIPTYAEGSINVGEDGAMLHGNMYYHVTARVRASSTVQPLYNEFSLMFKGQGADTVYTYRTDKLVLDCSTELNHDFEVSFDLIPSEDIGLYAELDGVASGVSVGLIDMQVHRVYSGVVSVPDTVAPRPWVSENFQGKLTPGTGISIDENNVISAEAAQQVQADWDQSDSTAVDFIKNKPDLSQFATTTDLAGKADKVTGATAGDIAVLDANGNLTDTGIASVNLVHDASYVHTDENFTSAEKTKLSGIEAGAEVNVQANWAETDPSSDAYIANKPSIPPAVTVDQTYDASSTNAQSGTAVAEAISTVNEVPASTSTDEGKVLTVDSQGEPVWATAQAPISAGNGVDITNNVVSAKVDGTSVTFNANGELTATASGGGVNDVEVNGTSVVNAQGVAEVTVPTVPALKELVAGSNITITEGANNVTIAATASAQVNSDWNAVSGVAEILNKPNLATVATTGDYGDLSNTPNLATVATSGDYDDLTNKPTIPAAQVNSDWNASTGVAQILNKPSLATVATTGDYSDLNNTPSLATVATTGDYSDLSGTPTLATVATSGDYDDLTNKPTIPAAQVNSDWNASTGVAQILNKPTLATVATSGDYGDLTNKPTINNVPAVTSSDDGKILTADYTGGVASYSWETPTAVPVIGTITI